MWIITNRGLVSVVEDRDDRDTLIVRARQDGLLEELLADAEIKALVWQDEYADYPNRVRLSRLDFTNLVYSQVLKIDYPNFKNSVKDRKLATLLMSVWTTLSSLGMGKYYGYHRGEAKKVTDEFEDAEYGPEEAFFKSLPKGALLDDGSLDPEYIKEH